MWICKRIRDHSVSYCRECTLHGHTHIAMEESATTDQNKRRNEASQTHWMVRAVIYLISPAHNSQCTSLIADMHSGCPRSLSFYVYAMRVSVLEIPVLQCEMAWDQNQFFDARFIQVQCRTLNLKKNFERLAIFVHSLYVAVAFSFQLKTRTIIFMTCFPCRFIEFAKIKFEFILFQCNWLETRTLSEHPNQIRHFFRVFI